MRSVSTSRPKRHVWPMIMALLPGTAPSSLLAALVMRPSFRSRGCRLQQRAGHSYRAPHADLFGGRDASGDGGGGGHVRAGQVDLTPRVAHPPHEVAVGGADGALPLGQDAHVTPQAWSAGGCGHHGLGVQEYTEQSFFHSPVSYTHLRAHETVLDL